MPGHVETAGDQDPGMDIFTAAGIVLRRWPIVLPILALTALGVWYAAGFIQPTYEASGSMLLQPVDMAVDDGSQGRALNNFVLAEILRSDETVQELQAQGLPTDYEIQPQENGGILSIEAVGTAPEGLSDTVSALLDIAESEIASRQSSEDGVVESDAFVVLSAPMAAQAEAFTIATTEAPALVHYVARGSAVVTNFSVGDNPYSANSFTTRVLTAGLVDPTFLDEYGLGESDVEFEIGSQPRDTAPIVDIIVTGSSRSEVTTAYGNLQTAISDRLGFLQDVAGAAPSARLQLVDLVAPMDAELASTNLIRPLVTLAALGVIAAVTVALAVDGVIARRRAAAEVRPRESDFVKAVPPPPSNEPGLFTATKDGDTTERIGRDGLPRRRKPKTTAA